MRGFDELEAGQFFLCTETSPRCFVIQQVNEAQLDDTVREMRSTSSAETSTNPNSNEDFYASVSSALLPWWFTAEVRQQLLSIPPPASHMMDGCELASTPDRPPSSISTTGELTPEEYLKIKLKRQLEYYFSRENLINDRYLRSQMDADQYVPIRTIASFPKVAQLTKDLDLIVSVLRSSNQIQVDDRGEKVRATTRRCTIILREIPESTDEEEVKAMFAGCPAYQTLTYGLNDSWYVTFATEEDTRSAFVHIQGLGKTFNGKPVYARIKAGSAPMGADVHSENKYYPDLRGHIQVHHDAYFQRPSSRDVDSNRPQSSSPSVFNLGQILALYGYVPRATFRPSIAPAPAPMLTMSTSSFSPLQPSPTSYFSQPIISTVNGFSSFLENCSGGEQSGSSKFDASSTSTVGTLPKVGKQRITDCPRINRSDRRSPLFFNNNPKKLPSQKMQSIMSFESDGIIDGSLEDGSKFQEEYLNFYSGKPAKYNRQQSADNSTATNRHRFQQTSRTSERQMNKEKRGGNLQLKPLNNWKPDGYMNFHYQHNNLSPNYYDRNTAQFNQRNSNFHQTNGKQQPRSLMQSMSPVNPLSWRHSSSKSPRPNNHCEKLNSIPNNLFTENSWHPGDQSLPIPLIRAEDQGFFSSVQRSHQHTSSVTNSHNRSSVSLLNGHRELKGSSSSTSTLTTLNTGNRKAAVSFGRKNKRNEQENDHGQNCVDQNVNFLNGPNLQQSEYNFVDIEFPSLDNKPAKTNNTIVNEEEKDVMTEMLNMNRIQFSAVVAGGRRASSSEILTTKSLNGKENSKSSLSPSYAQTLKSNGKIQIQRRESASLIGEKR